MRYFHWYTLYDPDGIFELRFKDVRESPSTEWPHVVPETSLNLMKFLQQELTPVWNQKFKLGELLIKVVNQLNNL